MCQFQRRNCFPLLVFPARGLRFVLVHGREILLCQRPRLRAVRYDVPQVALHCLPAVRQPASLVLPCVAVGNGLCRLARQPRAPLRVVFLHRRKAVLYGLLCGIYTQNTASVFSLHVLRVDITAQQLVHRPAVLLCQKLVCSDLSSLAAQPFGRFIRGLQRIGAHGCRHARFLFPCLPLRRLVRLIPLHAFYIPYQLLHGVVKTVSCIGLKIGGIVPIISVQFNARFPNAARHFTNALQLVQRCGELCVKQFRIPFGKLRVFHVDRRAAFVRQLQVSKILRPHVFVFPAASALAVQRQCIAPQLVFQILVLVVVFVHHDNAAVIRCIEHLRSRGFAYPAVLLDLHGHSVRQRFQVFAPCALRHAQCVAYAVYKCVFPPVLDAL